MSLIFIHLSVIQFLQQFYWPGWEAGQHFSEKLEKGSGGICLAEGGGGECGWRQGG